MSEPIIDYAKLVDAAERAVEWFDRFAAEPEDVTVQHELMMALGKEVEHRYCQCPERWPKGDS